MNHFLNALRGLTFPSRPHDQEIRGVVARRTGASVVDVKSVSIRELDAVVALFLDRWHGEDIRFCAKIEAQPGIGRVRIGRLNCRICGRVDAGCVVDFAPRSFELGVLGINEICVLDTVAVHQRKAVDVRLLGDRAGLSGADSRLSRHTQSKRAECDDRTDRLQGTNSHVTFLPQWYRTNRVLRVSVFLTSFRPESLFFEKTSPYCQL